MTMQEQIREIHAQIQAHGRAEVTAAEPFKTRRNPLRGKAAQRRGLSWQFTLTDRSVVVTLRKE